MWFKKFRPAQAKTCQKLIVSGMLALVTQAFPSPVLADVKLHGLFSDHMVLQRERPLPVWGIASPGEKVTVTFRGATRSTTANADGKWMVELAPQSVSATPLTLTVRGNNEIQLSDVLVGDVWLGSGQSNMDFTVNGTDGQKRIMDTPESKFATIRLYKVPEVQADEPASDIDAKWQEAKYGNIAGFSATLFYFGEELHQRMPDVPLGLIRSSLGATNAYSWIPNDVRDQDASSAYLRQWWKGATNSWTPEKQATYDTAIADYSKQVADYKARNERVPDDLRKPGEIIGPKWSRRPSALYNGMIAPLQPFSLRGTIWYQGEWDAKHDWVKVYHDTFLSLAKSWRANWAKAANNPKSGDFPIYLVQLPSRIPGDGDFWPYMREVQQNLGADVPNSGFVTTLDLNDGTDLHPKEKTEIGRRLARLALAKEYKQSVAYHGPWFKSAKVDGNRLVVTFDSGGGDLKSSDGASLRNFEVAGANGKYFAAIAALRGSTVVISAPEVPAPITVRYGWAPTLQSPNFFNSEGLPAAPFRTDSQPVPER